MKNLPLFIFPIVALSLSMASPQAFAQQASNADTYREVVAHGVVILTPDLEIDVKFAPEGRFVALGGLSKGDWKIVGEKMCSKADETGIETCAVYPAGKKSGDEFPVKGPDGEVKIRIK